MNTFKPYPCSEEAEPDSGTTDIVHKGFYPVFEGFWDYEVGHLSNNFLPSSGNEDDSAQSWPSSC